MAISVHPYITGVPHRIGYLERLYEYIRQRPGVWLWTGEQILDWYQIGTLSSGQRAEALLPKLKERARALRGAAPPARRDAARLPRRASSSASISPGASAAPSSSSPRW